MGYPKKGSGDVVQMFRCLHVSQGTGTLREPSPDGKKALRVMHFPCQLNNRFQQWEWRLNAARQAFEIRSSHDTANPRCLYRQNNELWVIHCSSLPKFGYPSGLFQKPPV